MTNIFGITKENLEFILVNDGKKKFMATQIFEWIYNKHEYNVDNFSNINNDLLTKEEVKTCFLNIYPSVWNKIYKNKK